MKSKWQKAKKRFTPITKDKSFYAVIDKKGHWIDSAHSFALACQWAAYNAGEYDARTYEGRLEWMETEGKKLGYSIIHSKHLKHFINAGLIK